MVFFLTSQLALYTLFQTARYLTMPSVVNVLLNALFLGGVTLGEVCKCVSFGVLQHDSCCYLMAGLCSNAGFRLLQTLVGRHKRNGTHSMILFLADLSVLFHLHPSATLPSPTTTRSPAPILSPTGRPGSSTQPTLQAAPHSRRVNQYTRTEPASLVIQMQERRVVTSAPCLLTLSTQQSRATFNKRLHSQKRTTLGSSSRILGTVVFQGECNRVAPALYNRVHMLTSVTEARVLEASREDVPAE